jgi:hypothetical protein
MARAKHAAATLKSEYEAGKRGDDTPAEQIWPSPREQLDGLLGLWKSKPAQIEASSGEAGSVDADAVATDAADAEAVADAMRKVDWSAVRAATSEKTGDAAKAMRQAAEHVDWSKVQPVAAQVSSALIAAVASGRLGIGGPLGSTVARTIMNQGMAQRVANQLKDQPAAMPVEFRGAIEAQAREMPDV